MTIYRTKRSVKKKIRFSERECDNVNAIFKGMPRMLQGGSACGKTQRIPADAIHARY